MKHLIIDPGPKSSSDIRGFFSFVNQYLAACRHYRDNENIVIDFDLVKKSKYYDPSISDTENVWEYFFLKKNQNYSEEEIISWGDFGNFYGYGFDFENKEEREISEFVINKYLILKPEILDKINNFYKDNFSGKRVLGIHKRGTDIGYHERKRELIEYFNEVDCIKEDYDLIFLSTDERSVVNEFKKRYPNVISYSYESLSMDPNKPSFVKPKTSIHKIGEDTLIDAFLLSKTDFLLQTNSNLSNFSLLANSGLKHKRI